MGVLESSQKFAATQQTSQQEKATFKMLGKFLMCLPHSFPGWGKQWPRPQALSIKTNLQLFNISAGCLWNWSQYCPTQSSDSQSSLDLRRGQAAGSGRRICRCLGQSSLSEECTRTEKAPRRSRSEILREIKSFFKSYM